MSALTPGFGDGARACPAQSDIARTQPRPLRHSWRIAIAAQRAETGQNLASTLQANGDHYCIDVFQPPVRHTDGIGFGNPDVLVIQDDLLGQPLQSTVTQLLQQRPELRILVFGAGLDDEQLAGLLRAGAHGYLDEQAGPDDIRSALDQILAGRVWAEQRLIGHCTAHAASDNSDMAGRLRRNIDSLCIELTRREKEILCQVIRGYAIKQIAAEVHLSHQGVKMHLARLFRKFGASNRNQLILAVLDRISPVKGLCAVLCEELKSNLAETTD